MSYNFIVQVTRVTTYGVDAGSYAEAEAAALGNWEGAIPQVLDEETTNVSVEQNCDVVQVVFEHASGTKSSPYAYGVPEGIDYMIGDELLVPPNGTFTKSPQIVRVVGVGRQGYMGPLKMVVGKVLRPDPEPNVFEDFRDSREDKDFGTCPDCGYAYRSAEASTPCGGTMS
jgi:hypothetical protein